MTDENEERYDGNVIMEGGTMEEAKIQPDGTTLFERKRKRQKKTPSEAPASEKPENQPAPAEKKPNAKPKKHKPTSFPPEVTQFLKKHEKKGLMIFKGKVFEDYTWDEVKELNKNLNTKPDRNKNGKIIGFHFENPSVVVMFPNAKGRMFVRGLIAEHSDASKLIPILSKDTENNDPKDIAWIDEVIDKKKKMKTLVEEKLFSYVCSINGEYATAYSQEPLDKDAYDIEALFMPYIFTPQNGINQIANRYLIINKNVVVEDFSDVAEKKFPDIQSISPVWDYIKSEPIYDEVETFTILSSAMFMILGFPAIGLILCGGTRARKTAWLESFKEIFKDYVIVMNQQSSEKGLLVSHYGDRPTTGLVFNAKFITMLDEFMRAMYKGSDRDGRTQALLKNCSDYMNVIEHKEYPYTSGKGTVFATLKSSFIATDNTVFRAELAKAWKDDSASLRRFTFLKVSRPTEEKAMHVGHVNSRDIPALMTKKFSDNKTFKNLSEYAKFFRYGRSAIAGTTLTPEERNYLEKIKSDLKEKYRRDFPLEDTIEAFFMCWKFWSQHIECMPQKIFEDAVDRIYASHKELLEPDPNDWKDDVKKIYVNPELLKFTDEEKITKEKDENTSAIIGTGT